MLSRCWLACPRESGAWLCLKVFGCKYLRPSQPQPQPFFICITVASVMVSTQLGWRRLLRCNSPLLPLRTYWSFASRRIMFSFLTRRSAGAAAVPSATGSPSMPRTFPIDGFQTLGTRQLFEQETMPEYEADHFYPVRLGEVSSNRYQTVTKLGYGSSSTIWLARDLQQVSPT